MSESALHSVVSEGQHLAGKNVGMFISKGSLSAINDGHLLTHGLHGTLQSINEVGAKWGLSGGAAAVGGLGGLVVMGSVGVISAAVAQMDYRHEIAKMKELYRNELAAKLGKPAKSVTDDDLYDMAKGDPEKGIPGNKIIADEISQKRKERALGVGLSAGASAASFGVMAAILSTAIAGETVKQMLGGVAEVAAASIGLPGAGAALFLVMETVLGIGVYNAIKQPLHAIGHKIFGLDKETTHDRIANLQKEQMKGKAITQEQVLDVFVSANKELGEYVEKQYGKTYEELKPEERKQVAADVNNVVPLAKLTDDINAKKYDIGELAFALEGQPSGYQPHPETVKHSWMEKAASGVVALMDRPKHGAKQYAAPAQDAWHPANEQTGKKSFVERHAPGRTAEKPALGHVERLDQARSEGPAATQLA